MRKTRRERAHDLMRHNLVLSTWLGLNLLGTVLAVVVIQFAR